MNGWTGRALEVDLSSGTYEFVQTDEALRLLYVGGRGFGVRIVADRLAAGTDPLSPDNLLVFAPGPLTGTRAPTSGRHAVVSKSPLTGTIFDGNAGGRFGAAMKSAGLDYIAITGRAASPTVLAIDGEQVSLESAEGLWGVNRSQVLAALSERGSVACIGKAGERKARIAAIMHDRGSAAGRGGLGAVMGSKLLKAIVVRGEHKTTVADEEAFARYYADIMRLLIASPVSSKGLAEYGTSSLVNLINYMRVMPTSNFRRSAFESAEAVAGETIATKYSPRRTPCAGCPIGCKRETRDGREVPEYETIALFGPSNDNADLESLVEINALCNEYGLDSISAGAAIACYAELQGEPLRGGDIADLVRQMGEGEGVGEELVQGALRFASARGKPEAAMQVKGLELPGYDPRGVLGLGLGYATSNRGGCHLRAYMVGLEILGKPKLIDRTTWVSKPWLVALAQNIFTAVDALVVCKFTLFSVGEEEFANILSAVTGVDYPSETLIRAGERIWNVERMFNLREGFVDEDDTLPARFFEEDGDERTPRIDRAEFERALREYYAFRGWDAGGRPTEARLQALSLEPSPQGAGV
ncbi:MAG: aldehyde ferredoxin oxidoreductase family protein [Armatimonadota bacterium]|nr:MAG: aldehyde ferredoxin oxidoreductase family protein [Armatimonadota bacterium]